MRRDPPFEKLVPYNVSSVSGTAAVTPDTSGVIWSVDQLTVASNGPAGSASFHWGSTGPAFKTLSIPAGGTEGCVLGGLEGPIGSGLYVTTTADMNVTAIVTLVDETSPITKEQARANTYSAYKAQKAAGLHAVRTPNRFGDQTEG
jgi:hypothetical protein